MNKQLENGKNPYPIGTYGKAWGDAEKLEWLNLQSVKRSYKDEVLVKLEGLRHKFNVEQYGALSYNESRYPLFAVKSKHWDQNKQTVLITGGVHGYETSGVQGAIRFLQTEAKKYSEQFNIVVAPCVSPWGYETINRWNPNAVDPNRSFHPDSPSEEAANILADVAKQQIAPLIHIDLHETTDKDASEFGPALGARNGETFSDWDIIPDGFYLVGDEVKPQESFQKAVITEVEKITHIAPPDEKGQLIGKLQAQKGVVNYPSKKVHLCAGLSDAKYVTTTEVYPDSPKVDDENCIVAQVTAVVAALEYIIANE